VLLARLVEDRAGNVVQLGWRGQARRDKGVVERTAIDVEVTERGQVLAPGALAAGLDRNDKLAGEPRRLLRRPTPRRPGEIQPVTLKADEVYEEPAIAWSV
jgi:hypothetical protein